VLGVVGRTSGQVRLRVAQTAGSRECVAAVCHASRPGSTLMTDEWNGYRPVPKHGRRGHQTVDHSGAKCTWALDRDGDGVREVHCNTQEGLWTGLRNFLRPFRGVSKWFLSTYVALFQWSHNLKLATNEFLHAMLRSTIPAS
jgi:transposase